MLNIGAIFSTLGNSNSLIPLAIKDMSSTAGITASSFATGKEEGQDRFIDEVGTQILWLMGIPGFKWLFDKTIFKASGLDSEFDVRNLKDKDVFEKIKEYAPTEDIKKGIEKIGKKQNKFKNVALAKFFVATGATIGSYIGLTKAKHAYTEKKIKSNLIAEYNLKKQQEFSEDEKDKNTSTIAFQAQNKHNSPSFKGVGSVVKYFAFSPVNNMYLLDGAITFERLRDSRTEQEFAGYAIKEGSLLFFMYYIGKKIQDYFENRANNKFGKNISLDSRVIESNILKESFENGSVLKSLAEFKEADKSDVELYEFLHKNPDNLIVKVAKKTAGDNSDVITVYKEKAGYKYGIIPQYKETNKIDTRKHIDLNKVRDINKNIDTLYSQYKKSLINGETIDKFFTGVKKLKRNSIIMNIGTSIFALGILTPAVMLAKRMSDKSDVEFKTKTNIREQMIKDGLIEA